MSRGEKRRRNRTLRTVTTSHRPRQRFCRYPKKHLKTLFIQFYGATASLVLSRQKNECRQLFLRAQTRTTFLVVFFRCSSRQFSKVGSSFGVFEGIRCIPIRVYYVRPPDACENARDDLTSTYCCGYCSSLYLMLLYYPRVPYPLTLSQSILAPSKALQSKPW